MRPLGQVGVGGRYHLLELPLLALSQAYHYFSPPTPQSLSGKNQLEGSGVDVGGGTEQGLWEPWGIY